MPAVARLGLSTTDTFTHAWDLARATGQDTNLAPALAAQLLEPSRQSIQPAFRSEEGTIFGFGTFGPFPGRGSGACCARGHFNRP